MNPKPTFPSNSISKLVIALLIILIILVVFQAGFMVGYHKGVFSSNLDRNYMRGPNDPRSFFEPFMHEGDDVNPHGAVGEIVSMNLPVIMIKGPRMAEEVILVNSNTTVRNFRQTASTSDLSIGKSVIVIGEPNERGEIEASLVRIIPAPPFSLATSTATPTRPQPTIR
jgi:hypothetical protein